MQKDIVHQLPKVELHCHLDGSIPMATLKEFARKDGVSEEELAKAYAPESSENLAEYLESFDIILQFLQTKENLTKATHDLIAEVSSENVVYIEIRFAPLFHVAKGLTVTEVIHAVTEGVSLALKTYPIHVNLLICAMRHHSNETNTTLLNTIASMNSPHIVGFDFAGNEESNANDSISEVTNAVHEQGLSLTLHSGECHCARNVVTAVQLGAKRIGHGVAIQHDPEAMLVCKENGTLLEMCPTSNIQTKAVESWNEYPLTTFMDAGLLCSINTDNRTVSKTTLTEEFMKLHHYVELTYEGMFELTLNAIKHSFAEPSLKRQMEQTIRTQFEVLA